ncbi:MAG: F0F1 ATP synthase subunit B' [Proteobacteria bacterium]|nr:MAG: F0F1 ATP synthase subunit B' [Pseudomonadota bacterium]
MAQKSAQPVSSMEHIPASEQHARGFPPFDSHTFPSQIFWLVLTFIVLYLLMWKIALPRIQSILDTRRHRIEDDLTEAQRLKGASDAALAAHEKALAEARGRAQTLANEARSKAAAAGETRRKEIEDGLNEKVSNAEKSIAADRSAAMTSVRGIARDAAGAIVERLTGIRPSSHEIDEAVGTALKR